MRFRVDELARRAGISVDTLRYYQGRGLLQPPEREGRVAWYDGSHLARLARIADLSDRGFSLAQIADLGDESADPLLEALASHAEQGPSRGELAELAGVEPALVDAAVAAGLLAPLEGHPERFRSDAAIMLSTGRLLLDAGLSLSRLLDLAERHAAHVDQLAEDAVALVRSEVDRDHAGLAELLTELMPAVSTLVADHFAERLLAATRRAVEASSADRALGAAAEGPGVAAVGTDEASEGARLEVVGR